VRFFTPEGWDSPRNCQTHALWSSPALGSKRHHTTSHPTSSPLQALLTPHCFTQHLLTRSSLPTTSPAWRGLLRDTGRHLTSLVGGDVHRCEVRGEGALVGDAVHRLDLEGVLGVGQQIADVDAGLRQAQLAWGELHVVPTTRARPTAGAAALADDVVHQVLPAPRVPRRGPLQHQRGLVYAGDDGLGGRRDGCKGNRQKGVRARALLVATGPAARRPCPHPRTGLRSRHRLSRVLLLVPGTCGASWTAKGRSRNKACPLNPGSFDYVASLAKFTRLFFAAFPIPGLCTNLPRASTQVSSVE